MDSPLAPDLFGSAIADDPLQRKAAGTVARLLRDIADCREEIRRREEFTAVLEARLAQDLVPLQEKLGRIRLETFRILVGHVREGRLRKRARRTLIDVLCEFADELESEYGFDVEKEMRSILPESELEDMEAAREFFNAMFDAAGARAEAGAGDADPDDAFAQGPEGAASGAAGKAGFGPAGGDAPRGRRGRKPKGPKSKAALKREAEEQALTGDIRALYLLLARALHPDKETDPSRVAEKTGWMQKVTAAYRAKDLSQLLDILARNPLEAVGPYLSQAPAKTVQGFAKRLRRELEALRRQAQEIGGHLHPVFSALVRQGRMDDAAFKRFEGELKKNIRFFKQRRDAYRDPEAVMEMIGLLDRHSWEELM